MSVNALKPTFRDREGYLAWRKSWKAVYKVLSQRLSARKLEVRAQQRAAASCLVSPPCELNERTCHGCGLSQSKIDLASLAQKELHLMGRDATKMMTLLKEAKERRDRIIGMAKSIADQPFPLSMEGDRVDLFFNKASIEYPVLPKWVLKNKGKSYYVDHIDADLPWNTRELDSGPTLGMIRFRKCQIDISADRVATLRQ